MFYAKPTKQGLGLELYCDYFESSSLLEIINDVACQIVNDVCKHGQYQVLMNFAYEIRKAHEGKRLKDKLPINTNFQKNTYYGTRFIWTDILIMINVLRNNSAYIPTTRKHHAYLYSLESAIENALVSYNDYGHVISQLFIDAQLEVSSKYLLPLYQIIHILFVKEKNPYDRFKKIPQLFQDLLLPYSTQYKEMVDMIEEEAKKFNTLPEYYEFTNFPDLKW